MKEFIFSNKRDSNLELFRIIVMLLIVAHHYVVNSGLWDIVGNNPLAPNSLFFYILGAWGKIGINCFVLITGYFMCEKHITSKKLLTLLLEIYFYCIIIWAIFLITGYSNFSIKETILLLLPVKGLNQNFTSCYIFFLLLIPFLNVLIEGLSKKNHIILLSILLIGFSLIPTLLLNVTFNYATWFCILFLIGSYLKKYPTKFENNTTSWAIIFATLVIIGIFCIIAILWFNNKFGYTIQPYFFISDCNKILSVAIAVSFFMLFKSIKMRHSNTINLIASSCFGVLLIHANSDTMRDFLWKDIVKCTEHYSDQYFWLYSIAAILSIYIVCTLIDQIRKITIEKPSVEFVEQLYQKLKSRILS